MTIALRRSLVLGLVLSISIAGGALAKDRPLKKDGPKTEGVPPADAAGVNKVFGEGKAPPTFTPPNIVGGVWDKTIIIGPEKTSHEVEMAFDDIAIAKAGKRVFENANPFKLPNNLYTFVILTSGITSFGNPLDETEIGTRHAHLGQGRPVAASGELVKSTAGIRSISSLART